MFSGKVDDRARVFIPAPADDRPSWTKVSVIAAVGFLVGVAWPKVVGVRLGPSLPAEATSVAAASASAPAQAVPQGSSAPSLPAAVNVPAPPPATAAPAAPAASVSVGHGVVFACRSPDGTPLKGTDCGSVPGLDGVVTPRLRKLAECPDAATASGKLHLVAHPDFAKGSIGIDLGKGPNAAPSEALVTCAKAALSGASVASLPHENPRYSVSYVVTFASGASGASGASSAPSNASPSEAPAAEEKSAAADDGVEGGKTQIVWDVAIVRDAPRTGKVVARLQHGTEVHLGSSKDGWFPVKYGDGFASDGWLYRGAVGK